MREICRKTTQELAMTKPNPLHDSLERWLLRTTGTAVPVAANAFVSWPTQDYRESSLIVASENSTLLGAHNSSLEFIFLTTTTVLTHNLGWHHGVSACRRGG